jgi:hypothetical protein
MEPDKRRLRSRVGDFVSSFWTRTIAGPAIIAVYAEVDPVPAKLGLLLVGLAVTSGGSWVVERRFNRSHEQRRKDDARAQISRLLHSSVTSFEATRPVPAERTLRANVMLANAAGEMTMTYYSEGYTEGEAKVPWRRGQGTCGEAFSSGVTCVAPESDELPVKASDADRKTRPWNMSPEQVRWSADRIRSVISAPIRLPGNRKVVGVLNFDDSRPLAESLLSDREVAAAVESLAEHIGQLLDEFKLLPPGIITDP